MELIYKFHPYLKKVIWGGNRIAALKGCDCSCDNIGESWEISGEPSHESVVAGGPDDGLSITQLIGKYGESLVGRRLLAEYGSRFPLLVKIIDARQDLSVQVHPGDRMARERHGCEGKTEMWYVVSAAPDAWICSGFRKPLDPAAYPAMVADNSIMDALALHSSKEGDVFFVPAGRIHSIGAGNLLVEVQQASDITYRVYDYGRRDADGHTRELHTAQAFEALDFHVYDNYTVEYDKRAPGIVSLIDCPYFQVSKLTVDGRLPLPRQDSFLTMTCVKGSCLVSADGQQATLLAGETCMVAAAAQEVILSGEATLIAAKA